MPSKPKVFHPYWDSCVFISALERTPGRIDVIDGLKNLAMDERVLVVTSSIVLAEVIKLNAEGFTVEQEMDQIRDFLENPWITRRVADTSIMERAGYLRRRHKLQLGDSIHLATALRYEVSQLQTYDHDLLKLNDQLSFEKRIGKLRICHPEIPDTKSYPLFEGPETKD